MDENPYAGLSTPKTAKDIALQIQGLRTVSYTHLTLPTSDLV